jgi:7-cyano-7-deazaguanine synthase
MTVPHHRRFSDAQSVRLKKGWISLNINIRMAKSRSCVVLFSGGIDSTTALYWARRYCGKVSALSIDYGQRHRVELRLGRRLTRRLGLQHEVLKLDLRQVGGSALTDRNIPVPALRRTEEIKRGVPLTYVPFRNGIFLALAAAWAEVRGIRDIICGFHTIDSPNYPDTRAPFVKAMERAIKLGTRAAFSGERPRIIAPFIRMTKAEIIRRGLALGADYSNSISCYRGDEIPCGGCSACLLRREAWREAGAEDHLLRRLKKEGRI